MRNSPGSRFRPAVEHLEAREVPASFTAATVPELIAAIDAANLTPEADMISLAAGKTFTLTLTNLANNDAHGETGLPMIAAGDDLTVIGNGATIERKDSNWIYHFRLFDVAAEAALTLQNLTLKNGWAYGFGEESQGGAIRNSGTLNLDGVTVTKCTAEGSASEYAAGSACGGGIYSDGTLNVVNSRIESNSAAGGAGKDAYRVVNVMTGSVSYYSATPGGDGHGGGISLAGGSAEIRDTTITGNRAAGGIGGDGMTATAYYGGYEYVSPGAAGGDARGGGLCCDGGAVSLSGVTVAANQVQGGAGGAGVKGEGRGANGVGLGGGIFIAPEAAVGIDAFTLTHAKKNHASTADDNISGL